MNPPPEAAPVEPGGDAHASTGAPHVVAEGWQVIAAAPQDAWVGSRASVFTYVIAGDVGGQSYDGGNERFVLARADLVALLREAEAMSTASQLGDATLLQANLFCIPTLATAVPSPADPLASYDFALAGAYRRYVAALVADNPRLAQHLVQPGPFLVALRVPVAEVRRAANDASAPPDARDDVLLIDMSGAPAEVIPIYVSSFKNAVRQQGIASDGALAPLRARFAAAVVDLNQALPLIEEAYAGAVKSFETPSADGTKEAQK